MRTFTCPAKYRRFVEAQLALAIAEVGRDIARRGQDEHIVRAYDSLVSKRATIPEQFIDAEKGGDLLILVGDADVGCGATAADVAKLLSA